jgi:hypothetical protein
MCVTAPLVVSDRYVAASERRRTCDHFDEVGVDIPHGRRRRDAAHGVGSSLCDYVTAVRVTNSFGCEQRLGHR